MSKYLKCFIKFCSFSILGTQQTYDSLAVVMVMAYISSYQMLPFLIVLYELDVLF
jgi:hypothetical protein